MINETTLVTIYYNSITLHTFDFWLKNLINGLFYLEKFNERELLINVIIIYNVNKRVLLMKITDKYLNNI